MSETFLEREIICPECCKTVSDSWEYESNDEIDCECGCTYVVEAESRLLYSTKTLRTKQ